MLEEKLNEMRRMHIEVQGLLQRTSNKKPTLTLDKGGKQGKE